MYNKHLETGTIFRAGPHINSLGDDLTRAVRKAVADHRRLLQGPYGPMAGRRIVTLPDGTTITTWVNPHGLVPILMAQVVTPSGLPRPLLQSGVILIEHGLLRLDNSISFGSFHAAYYAGAGTAQPSVTDHVYNKSRVIDGVYAWSPTEVPGNAAPSLATPKQIVEFRAIPERRPSLWTGLMRHVAQAWAGFRDVTSASVWGGPSQLPRAFVQSGAQYLPGSYGLVRDLYEGVLTYWLIYCGGGVGGFGGTGDGAIGANGIGAVRCLIDPPARAWADALVAGVHPMGGQALTSDDKRMYEAVILRTLKVDPAATVIKLYVNMGDDSDPWSFRAHGMQWRPTLLGDLTDIGGDARCVQYRAIVDSAQQKQRFPHVSIAFTGFGESRAPVATVTGLGVAETICWPWHMSALWVPNLLGGHTRVDLRRPFSGGGLVNWTVANDSPGTLWGCWSESGWITRTYDGIVEESALTKYLGDQATWPGLPAYKPGACGEVPTYSGEIITNYSAVIGTFCGHQVASISGDEQRVMRGTVTLASQWDGFEGAIPDGCHYFYQCGPDVQYICDAYPPPYCDDGLSGGTTLSLIDAARCSGTALASSQYVNFWRQDLYTLDFESRQYDGAEYERSGAALVIGADDPLLFWIIEAKTEQTGAETLRGTSGAGDITAGVTGVVELETKIDIYNYATWWLRYYEKTYIYHPRGDAYFTAGWQVPNITVAKGHTSCPTSGLTITHTHDGESLYAYSASISTYASGALINVESISGTDPAAVYYADPNVSFEHLRARCWIQGGDVEEPLPQPGGIASGAGSLIYQRWDGDTVQATDGYDPVKLTDRFSGVA